MSGGVIGDRCPQFPLDINKDPCCHAQTDSITLWSAEATISTSLTPPTNHHKKSCKEQLKMKYDIALRQNCDQSAPVWWSTRSSARHWRVKERRLTLNKSTDNNREPTWTTTDILLEWVVLLATEPIFCNRAYRITNIGLDWPVHQVGVGQRGAHMTTAHSSRMLRHSTLDWLCSAHTEVRIFSTYCTNNGQEFPLHCVL